MDSIFEIVNQNVNILQVAQRYCNATPKRKGCYFWIRSPFQEEKTPSCCLKDAKNLFFDYSTNQGGDPIRFVALLLGISNSDACKLIAEDFGIEIEAEKVCKKQIEKQIKEKKRRQQQAKALINILEDFYSKICFNFQLYDGILKQIGHVLQPDDDLLKEVLLNRNHYEILGSLFILGTFEERFELYLQERQVRG